MNGYNGPIINKENSNPTTRDPLGIEGAVTTMGGYLSPLVTTVTPKPFIWIFLVWCYYDVYNNQSIIPYTNRNVEKYIKRQNFFLCLAAHLVHKYENQSFPGITYMSNLDCERLNSFKYDENYIRGLGTNNYYFGAIDRMELVVSQDRATFDVYNPRRIRKEGERLALAFDKVISQTEYYKNYRLYDIEVPKTVLIELGNKVSSNLEGFDECRQILIENLFSKNGSENLSKSRDYLNYVLKTQNIKLDDELKCREVLYEYYSPRGELNYSLPEELMTIANGWEVLVGRQYFTVGLQMIWKRMIEVLPTNNPITINEWIGECFADQDFFEMTEEVSAVIEKLSLGFDEREAIIRESRNREKNRIIKNGISLILSVFKRFEKRTDIPDEIQKFFVIGDNGGSISLDMFFRLVKQFENKTIKEFAYYIMTNYLINQHWKTAIGKLIEGQDKFYFEVIGEDKYCGIVGRDYDYGFQGIRMVELFSVMKDLEILGK